MQFLRKYPGLALVLVLLFWITVTSIKPGLYLIGWDNYSSYFGGLESLFRTFWSTWRGYRGIGVPSDSESVDVFRQGILLLLAPIVPEPFRDQIYIIACLWFGVLSVYLLVHRLIRRTIPGNRHPDIAAAIAAAAYVLNLSALSTFYFPIITYITRFASLPLLLLVFDRILHKEQVTRWSMITFVAIVLFSSGSFITATVFFTTITLLSVYILFQGHLLRGAKLLGLFVMLNAFWLLPFARYTLDKSHILRLAPVFVDTNEAQLNLASNAYGMARQLLMYPNFFDTRFTTMSTGNPTAFHPAVDMLHSAWGPIGVWGFPAVALFGVIIVLFRLRKMHSLLWAPCIYLLFLVLSSQEYSLLGFIPALLNRYVPYFAVVFRFGDTKFHPYMAVSGAVLIGVAVSWISGQIVRASLRRIAVFAVTGVIVVLPLATVYRSYIAGDFLPEYLLTSVPRAYRNIANHINADPGWGRVLHLPYDPDLYWRSHTWGYMGSAFMQYMLNKPYLDKTFEPASLETTDFYGTLTEIIRNANQTVGTGREERAEELLSLLQRYGVRWILFDESVSPEVDTRDIRYWGTFNTTDSRMLLETLEEGGSIRRISDERIDTLPEDDMSLMLYQAENSNPYIQFADQTVSVDPTLSRVSVFPNIRGLPIQKSDADDMVVYPMLYKDTVFNKEQNALAFRRDIGISGKKEAIISQQDTGAGYALRVSARNDGNSVEFSFDRLVFPSVNGISGTRPVYRMRMPLSQLSGITSGSSGASEFVANWSVLGHEEYSPVRLSVDGVIMPVPPIANGEERFVGDVLVQSRSPFVRVMTFAEFAEIPADGYRLTDNPNCFGDKSDSYQVSIDKEGDVVNLDSENGSSCVVSTIPELSVFDHAEYTFRYETDYEDGEDIPITGFSSKPSITEVVGSLPKPNLVSVCIQDTSSDGCANLHQLVNLTGIGSVIIPAERDTDGDITLRIGVIPVGLQSQHLTIYEIGIFGYRTIREELIELPNDQETMTVPINGGQYEMQIPYLLSRGSYYPLNVDGYFVTNRQCEQPGGYRTVRKTEAGYVGYIENCYSEMSVQLPFTSGIPKLWGVSYGVYSGKYPRILLGDPFGRYVDEYISLYQGYPDIPGMLLLRYPESWFRRYDPDTIKNLLSSQNALKLSFVRVPAAPELTDTRQKFYTFHQHSQNEGLVVLGGQTVIEYPASWDTIEMRVGDPIETYAPVSGYEWTEITPSLVHITSVEGSQTGKRLLVQRSGFDSHWRAYTSLGGLLTGIGGVTPERCDNFALCYSLSQAEEYFLLYTPERLAIAGWFASLFAAAIFLSKRRKLSRS